MSRRTRAAPAPSLAARLPLGADEGEGSLGRSAREHLRFLEERNYSRDTAIARAQVYRAFLRWATERSLSRPDELTGPILEAYQGFLFRDLSTRGRPLAVSVQRQHLTALRVWFSWLVRRRVLVYNPAAELLLPRAEVRLPRSVMSEAEAERVLAVPDVGTPDGLRDRAMLELLYSSGLRRAELAATLLFDLDLSRGTLAIRRGKGKRDRVVPVTERALAWLGRYVRELRPAQVVAPDPGTLFVSPSGGAPAADWVTRRVSRCVRRSGIEKRGSAHMFRHTLATGMLDNGADVRFVQELLGHQQLSTTQIYTHVAIGKLKAVHRATAPGQRAPPTIPAPDSSAAGEAGSKSAPAEALPASPPRTQESS